MTSTPRLLVHERTSIAHLSRFLGAIDNDNAELHAKTLRNGQKVLYVSKKSQGTGLKAKLAAKTFQQRKRTAKALIEQILREHLPPAQHDAASRLLVGDLKQTLEKPLEALVARRGFEAIGLDLAGTKAGTAFSAAIDRRLPDDRLSPTALKWRRAMDGVTQACEGFSAAQNADRGVDELLDFARDVHQVARRVADFFELVAPPMFTKDEALRESAEVLSRAMNADHQKLEYWAKLFANESFVQQWPAAQRDAARELGKQLTALYELTSDRQGSYRAAVDLAGLAHNAPAEFRNHLRQFSPASTLANLPQGATLDEHGNLGGSQVIRVVPDFSRYPELLIQAREFTGRPIEGMLQTAKSASMKKSVTIDGIAVNKQAVADFYRMNVDIRQPRDAVFRSADLPSGAGPEHQQVRNSAVALAVHRFANEDVPTTLVLSSVFNQTTISPLFHCLTDAWQGSIPLKMITAMNATSFNGPLKLRKADGTEEEITPAGMGACKWTFSHVVSADGRLDYKISIDWPTYAVPQDKGQESLRLAPDTVIGIHWKADFIVDGDEAREGRLKLSIPDGIVASFSGQIEPGRVAHEQA